MTTQTCPNCKTEYDPEGIAAEKAQQEAKQAQSNAWWEIRYGVASLVCFLIAVFIIAALFVTN